MKTLKEYFVEHYNNFINKTKKIKHISNKKYTTEQIFDALMSFISNNTYFARISKQHGLFNGKYFNKIHNLLVTGDFYSSLYTIIHNDYITKTKGSTLNGLFIDTTFVRNILGIIKGSNRNPHYYNKPGFKISFIVDKLMVPLSTFIVEDNDSDSTTIDRALDKIIISKSILDEHKKYFVMDSGYDSLYNMQLLSTQGYDGITGYNIGRKKTGTIKTQSDNDISKEVIRRYKKRSLVENINSIVQRYPILMNNYEKKLTSFNGLLMFTLCNILIKKMNKLEMLDNDISLKKKQVDKIKKEAIRQIERKNKRKIESELRENERKLEKQKREAALLIIKLIIIEKFKIKNVNDKIDELYENYVVNFNEKKKKNKVEKVKADKGNKKVKIEKVKDKKVKIDKSKKDKKVKKIKIISKLKKETYINTIFNRLYDKFLYFEIFKVYGYAFGTKIKYIKMIDAYSFDDVYIDKFIYNFMVDIETIINDIHVHEFMSL